MLKFLASYKPRIDTFLTSYLVSRSSDKQQINPWHKDAYERISSFVTSGKSIRGSLYLWSIEQYKGDISESDIALAGSLELIHSGFLIHDDIMDNDSMRRGNKTVFSQYEEIAGSAHIERTSDFGKNLALCVGDLALFLGMECMLQSTQIQGSLQSTVREFASVCIAQMQDVSFGMNTAIPSLEEVLSMYRYKTARYTMSMPLSIGAMVSGVPQSEQDLLVSLGEDMGILFQLSDDMLNLFGDSSKSGKSVGTDLIEEKKTFAFVTLMHTLSKNEAELLNNTVESDARLSLLNRYMDNYDIRSIVMQKIDELSKNVNIAIKKLAISESAKQELTDFSLFLKERTI